MLAVDQKWWEVTQPVFEGEKITVSGYEGAKQVKLLGSPKNSGAAALMYAASQDADKIIMLGFDCQYAKDGKRHWHGDHVKELGNAVSMPKWENQFMQIAPHLSRIDVVNCTRETALNFWRKADLESELV